MLENYYYDEFIAMLDAYNDMHRIDSESESGKEYYADDFQLIYICFFDYSISFKPFKFFVYNI